MNEILGYIFYRDIQGLSAELEASEGNDGEDSYSAQLTQEEVGDDIDTSEGQLLSASAEGDIITANGEIVSELVMEDGDPSVIVESIVNADGSVFVDERDFNNYCNNHLTHPVHDCNSPGTQGKLSNEKKDPENMCPRLNFMKS